MQYFLAQNVGQPIAGVQFEKYDIVGGTAFGVYATDNAAEISKLEALIATGKTSVQSITEAEYARCLKKKRPDYNASKLSNPTLGLVTKPGVAIKGTGAVVVEHSVPPEGVADSKVEVTAQAVSAEDALKLETGKPPEGMMPDPMAPKPEAKEPRGNKRPKNR